MVASNIGSLVFAVRELLGAEKSIVARAYSALIAVELRIGKYQERGRATILADALAAEIAAQRAGAKAWGAMDESAKMAAIRACASTAKRYADKAVGIAKQAADKGCETGAVMNAETDAEAQAIVKAWLFALKCHSTDALFETFGYSKPTAEKKAKTADAKAPSTAETPAPEAARAPEAAPAQGNDSRVGSVADFVAITRAVMANWTTEQRQEYAREMLAEMATLAAFPALTV